VVITILALAGVSFYKKWPSGLPNTLTYRVAVGGLSAGLLAFTAFGFVTLNVLMMNPCSTLWPGRVPRTPSNILGSR